MKGRKRILKIILKVLIITIVGGYFTSSLIESTFATNANKSPDVLVTINSDGKISQQGNLFEGQLYPATEKDAEKRSRKSKRKDFLDEKQYLYKEIIENCKVITQNS